MLKEIGRIWRKKIHDQELKSVQYLAYLENILIVLSLKHF